MRECDIVVGTLLFFSQKKKISCNKWPKKQHLKREKKKSQEKKFDFYQWRRNFPKSKNHHNTQKKNEFVSQICVSLCLQFLDR